MPRSLPYGADLPSYVAICRPGGTKMLRPRVAGSRAHRHGGAAAADVAVRRCGGRALPAGPTRSHGAGRALLRRCGDLRSITGPVGWRERPSWYVLCNQDGTLTPDIQKAMAGQLAARVVSVEASHAVAAQPHVVVEARTGSGCRPCIRGRTGHRRWPGTINGPGCPGPTGATLSGPAAADGRRTQLRSAHEATEP